MTRHLVVMAAGTGGHVIPGLAVAREMLARGWTVSWLGTTHGMENKLVPPSGIAMDNIAFSGVRGKGLLHTLSGGVRLLAAFWACARILRARRADAVLGMGGYVCFPGGLMASLLSRPLVLVNADAELLLSNKSLLPVADRVLFGVDGGGASQVKGAIVTGNPVRAEIEAIAPPAQRYAARSGPLKLLVVGGSLGARVLNEVVPAAIAALDEAARPQVTHQTGSVMQHDVETAYRDAGIDAELARDNTATGAEKAAGARAVRPDDDAKAEAWRLLGCSAYLCMDSDTVFLRPATRSDFLTPAGHPYTLLHQSRELLQQAPAGYGAGTGLSTEELAICWRGQHDPKAYAAVKAQG